MLQYVTTDWINAQAAGPVADLHLHRGLWIALDAGADPMATPYADWMRKRHEESTVAAAVKRRAAAYAALKAGQPLDPSPCTLNALGRYELLDGHHRCSAAAHLGLDRVPVDVQSVSPLWQLMSDHLETIYPTRRRYLYQSIEHPWYSGWTTSRSEERLDIVAAALDRLGPVGAAGEMVLTRNLLEIGSCTGRVCRIAARRGWRVFGVDLDRRVVAAAEYLDRVMGTSVSYLCAPLDAPPAKMLITQGPRWPVVVALSVFHAYHTTGRVDFAERWYGTIFDRAHAVITDCDQPGREYQGHKAVSEAEYRAWLCSLAPGWSCEVLGATEGRTIYLLKKGKNGPK